MYICTYIHKLLTRVAYSEMNCLNMPQQSSVAKNKKSK